MSDLANRVPLSGLTNLNVPVRIGRNKHEMGQTQPIFPKIEEFGHTADNSTFPSKLDDADTAAITAREGRNSILTQDQTGTDFSNRVHPYINKSPAIGFSANKLKEKPLLPLPRKRSLFETETNIKFSPKRSSPKVKKTLTQSNFNMKKRSLNFAVSPPKEDGTESS